MMSESLIKKIKDAFNGYIYIIYNNNIYFDLSSFKNAVKPLWGTNITPQFADYMIGICESLLEGGNTNIEGSSYIIGTIDRKLIIYDKLNDTMHAYLECNEQVRELIKDLKEWKAGLCVGDKLIG